MTQNITSVLQEDRLFAPDDSFRSKAKIHRESDYDKLWLEAKDHPESFWARQARELLDWTKPFSNVLEWNEPYATWFGDGQLNACVNCIDRHALGSRAYKPAIIWEGEPGDSRTLTYAELHAEVQKAANVLESLGIKSGDRVTIYMPMTPEIVIAVLACARIGAPHNVVFAGFSATALAERNNDAQSKLVITADGSFRRGSLLLLKNIVDESLKSSPTVQKTLVLQRTGQAIEWQNGRDHWWHEEMSKAQANHHASGFDAEHPLFLLYTSGSTGKPKGILHTTGGYLLGTTLSAQYVFDLKEDDIFWCTADVGWVTGHSYLIYGPLSNGASVVMYEGAPNYPQPDRFWSIIEKYKVTIFYTAPTAIRSFIKWGDEHVEKHDLSSLRLLGSVGEPINPEAWMWYRKKIGGDRCPIVDTWWQTETGSIMITPLPGLTHTTPGTATKPFFGVVPAIVDRHGNEVPEGEGGYLVITKPWPSMLRGIYGDDKRYRETYWNTIKGAYFTGDGARRDRRGYYWIMGRIDDVINVSGHRLSTMEIESALVSHEKVAEAAVVGKPHDLKGEAISCFVTLEQGEEESPALRAMLLDHIVKQIGALARPDEIFFTDTLPKTRSGKIMRRFLRDIAAGRENQGDASTLEDSGILAKLRLSQSESLDS